jgi:hypothetical protein
MPWYIVRKRSNSLKRAFIAVGAVFFVMNALAVTVLAVSTEVGVKVCGTTVDSASINITEPFNDSVVNQSALGIRATTSRTSQVVVTVDGAYNSTVALASNQTELSTNVVLPVGTHTITLTASEICGGNDATDEIVVTYQPEVLPSNGTTTPTTVTDAADEGTIIITDNGIGQSPDDPTPITPLIALVQSVTTGISSAIGLDATINNGSVPAATGSVRVVLTVAAVSLIATASSIAPVMLHALSGVNNSSKVNIRRSLSYGRWTIRIFAALLLALAFFI